jgi:predicted acylesterase/phospholipase RssA
MSETELKTPAKSAQLECDLIIKGGIASGLVCPGAIKVLSEHCRLRSIGGASAGAIAGLFRAEESTEAAFEWFLFALDSSGYPKIRDWRKVIVQSGDVKPNSEDPEEVGGCSNKYPKLRSRLRVLLRD